MKGVERFASAVMAVAIALSVGVCCSAFVIAIIELIKEHS